ncbi:nuclear transport factor 2 family protein [[Eubacterium] cellulosolvens]
MNKSDQTIDQHFLYHDSNKQSGTEKKILLMILILDILVISGVILYSIKPSMYDIGGIKSNYNHDENYVVLNSTKIPEASTEMPTPTFTTTYSTKGQESPIINEESMIRDTLTAYFDTLNTHSPEDAVKYFTDDVEITINYGKDYSYQGPKEGIITYLEMAFNLAPDSKISDVEISEIKINQNKATVQISYMISSEAFNFSMSINEYLDLVKQNNKWKIRRTNIEY